MVKILYQKKEKAGFFHKKGKKIIKIWLDIPILKIKQSDGNAFMCKSTVTWDGSRWKYQNKRS